MTAVDVLKSAREILANGWCKYALEDGEGNFCALGALHRAESGEVRVRPLEDDGREAFRTLNAISEHWGYRDVVDFNNHRTTTHEDVLTMFDKALAELGGLA